MATTSSASHVVIAFDATKNDLQEYELRVIINNVRARGDILGKGDKLVVLGILHKVLHPLGYESKACTDQNFGTSIRAMREETLRKVKTYATMLEHSAEVCKKEGVIIEVKITAGVPIKDIILREVISSEAAWLILDRNLRQDLMFYIKQIPCKVAILLEDSFCIEVLRSHTMISEEYGVGKKLFCDMSQTGFGSKMQATGNKNQSETSLPMKSSTNPKKTAIETESSRSSDSRNGLNIISTVAQCSQILKNAIHGVVQGSTGRFSGPVKVEALAFSPSKCN